MRGEITVPLTPPYELVTIVIENREQHPYRLPGFRTIRGYLPTADYAILGTGNKKEIQEMALLERKSLVDFVGCCGSGRENFVAELARLRGVRYRLVLVEGEWSAMRAGGWRPQVAPDVVLSCVVSFAIEYEVPILLVPSHEAGDDAARRFFRTVIRHEWQRLRALAGCLPAGRVRNQEEDATAQV